MSRILLDLATPDDDAELRRILRENAMDGDISVTFEREPSFFEATRIEGRRQEVVVGRRSEDPSRLVGLAVRSIRPMYLEGEVRELGYLSGLRIDTSARRSTALGRAWRYLRRLHSRDPVPLYFSTIIEDNREAIRILTSGRASLPTYVDHGRLRTHAVALLRKRRGPVAGIAVERGTPELLPEIAACMRRSGERHVWTPVVTADELAAGSPVVPGLSPEDFFVVRRGERVVACLARWDQSAFKQTVVRGYGGAMRLAKPVYDLAARVGGFAPLPAVGTHFPYFYAAFVAVDDDDPELFRALMHAVHDASLGGRYSFFMLGLHERDPLTAVLDRFRFTPYDARFYVVRWSDGADAPVALGEQIPRPEIAMM